MPELPETANLRKVLVTEGRILGLTKQWSAFAGREITLSRHLQELLKQTWNSVKAEQQAILNKDMNAQRIHAQEASQLINRLDDYYDAEINAVTNEIRIQQDKVTEIKKELNNLSELKHLLIRMYAEDQKKKSIKK